MSEYQYYEFVALDRPLSSSEQQKLRAISSRAEITSTRFSNEYHYGDFRGEPEQMMARYFDAMIYLANWGSRRFMMRLPKAAVDVATCKAYCSGDSLRCKTAGAHVVVDFRFELEDSEFIDDAEDWLSALVPLRADLMRGDLRALYLGWLACAQQEEFDDKRREPQVPPKLHALSAPLKRLAEFIDLDQDLLSVAAQRSTRQDAWQKGLPEFIAALPEKEKNQYLLALATSQDPQLGARLLAGFRACAPKRRAVAAPEGCQPERTVAELLEAAERSAEERERKEAQRAAQEKARREVATARARTSYLDGLVCRAELVWQKVEEDILSQKPKLRREAAQLLADLRDLALRQKTLEKYQARLAALLERHRSRWALLRELKKVGLLDADGHLPSLLDLS